jgi:hypothetical protein
MCGQDRGKRCAALDRRQIGARCYKPRCRLRVLGSPLDNVLHPFAQPAEADILRGECGSKPHVPGMWFLKTLKLRTIQEQGRLG